MITVTLQYIPAYYKNVNYIGRYHYYSARAEEEDVPYEELIITEKKYKTIYNVNESRNVLVQSQYYKTYKIIIMANETNEIELIAQARDLKVIDEYLISYNIEYLEKTYENVSNTKLKKITITYKKRLIDADAISSHSESSILISQFTFVNLVYINIAVFMEDSLYFATCIKPILKRETIKSEVLELANGIKKPFYQAVISYYDIKLYLSDDNLKTFELELARGQVNNGSEVALYNQSSSKILPISFVEYTKIDNDKLVNLNEVDVKFITAINEINYY